MRQYAAEIAASPQAKIKIYRTLEDGDLVLLHSTYEGLNGHGASLVAFDLFRFKDGKIVEHWGGQEPEAPPNPSGRTQVDGPTDVADRDKTEENRDLVRAFKETVTVQLKFDQVGRFIQDGKYAQHASKVGDGIARMKSRVADVAKPSRIPVLNPRRYVADGNFVLALVEANAEGGPTANYDLFRVENGRIVEHWDVLSRIRGSNGKILTALTEGCRSKNTDISTWNVCQGGMHEAHGAGGRTARATWCDYRLRSGYAGKNVDE
jgi:predicted SnoaL-like aldol condensation-catalyzing enzyme